MKNALILLAIAACLNVGCDWAGKKPVVSGCESCGKCATGCCSSGKCDTADCNCACKSDK